MDGFNIVNLDMLLSEIGEEKTKSILADYSCPLNADIENFLHHTAIAFAKQSIAKTHLVFTSYRNELVLVGYFTLANKTFFIKRSSALSATMRKRINKFATPTDNTNGYEIAAPLIAQLGKNYTKGYNKLITGDELLTIACDRLRSIQSLVGGKVAYLECEDVPRLIDFYTRNGFIPFDKRPLDKVDRDSFHSDHLVQLLRYF